MVGAGVGVAAGRGAGVGVGVTAGAGLRGASSSTGPITSGVGVGAGGNLKSSTRPCPEAGAAINGSIAVARTVRTSAGLLRCRAERRESALGERVMNIQTGQRTGAR